MRLLDGNYAELANKFYEAIKDGDLDEDDAIGLVVAVLDSVPKISDPIDELIDGLKEKLGNGQLTSREVAELAAGWVARRIPDEETGELLINAVQGNLAPDDIVTVIMEKIEGEQPELAAAARTALA